MPRHKIPLALTFASLTGTTLLAMDSCGGRAVQLAADDRDVTVFDSAPAGPSGIRDQSCHQSRANASGCGDLNEDCCVTLAAPAGEFEVGVNSGTYSLGGAPTTLSAFSMEKYEITVGRFRAFVSALEGGWRPRLGDGSLRGMPGSGWMESWPLTRSAEQLQVELNACAGTWTDEPSQNEVRPIACTTWFEVFAFCIWDGGRLPTMAERVYVALGGDEYRTFPWTAPRAFDAGVEDGHVAYSPEGGMRRSVAEPVGTFPLGAGRWGHQDLSGNITEWVIDRYKPRPFPTPGQGGCRDCAVLAETDDDEHVLHGGSYASAEPGIHSYSIGFAKPTARLPTVGGRCVK